MDVSCPRCKTEYEFDDARVPETGVTVKCTQCSHVFRVKRKGVDTAPSEPPNATTPFGVARWPEKAPHPSEEPAARPTPPSAPSFDEPVLPPAPPPREWKVRTKSGKVHAFQELTTLQKWIIERKVSRDDEISLTGENWKGLGAIAELSSFFQVVEEAQLARELTEKAAAQAASPNSITEPSMEKPVIQESLSDEEAALAALPTSAPRMRKGLPTAQPPKAPTETPMLGAVPRQLSTPVREVQSPQLRLNAPLQNEREVAAAPVQQRPLHSLPPRRISAARQEVDESDDELVTLAGAKGGAAKWIGILLVLLGVGGAAAWYFMVWAPQQAQLKAEAQQQELAAQQKAKLEAEALANGQVEPGAVVDAGMAQAVVDAGAMAVAPKTLDAGPFVAVVAVIDAGTVANGSKPEDSKPGDSKPDNGGKKEPTRDYDYYLSLGDRWRDREKPEAALEAYGKAAELNPDRAEAVAGRGLALIDMGKSEQGETALQKALKLNRRYGPAIMGLAEVYRTMGQTDKAIEYYELYLERLPNGLEANVAKNNIERLKK